MVACERVILLQMYSLLFLLLHDGLTIFVTETVQLDVSIPVMDVMMYLASYHLHCNILWFAGSSSCYGPT